MGYVLEPKSAFSRCLALSLLSITPSFMRSKKKRQSHFLIKAANHLEERFGCRDRFTLCPNNTKQISIVSAGSWDNGSCGLSPFNWGHRLGLA